ncbi:uncharacterized protein LOC6544451 isoform X2 [Drosophila erecta]|uniref:Uncharacterized protein n=1 Tax=Drosophila erecta TaxID=7220 RepID=B3NH06_DROER|nr:uncharacterized protein LOC6544451 isoform X2 [Drosophila erecta]EDV51463.1 uncharacterized protein Dere_GG15529 [Drosophila erecta]
MAQLKNVGQGQQAVVVGPLLASAMLLMGLIFALLGIKFFGFRRRLTFERSQVQRQQQNQRNQQQQPPPRYAAFESQVNGTDTAVHGVFRRRNLEEFESPWPSASTTTGNNFISGSVPNLQVCGASPREPKSSNESPVSYRERSEALRHQRKEVHSEHYEFYTAPPTRKPPSPPVQSQVLAETAAVVSLPKIPESLVTPPPRTTRAAIPPAATSNHSGSAASVEAIAEPPNELGMPNFDHFAEKYELFSVKPMTAVTRPTQLRIKHSGRYVKFEPVDDVPEILTPEDPVPELQTPDDGTGGAMSVTAVVHRGAIPKEEPESKEEPQAPNDPFGGSSPTDSPFVVEIIAGSPAAEATPSTQTFQDGLFENLELPQGEQDSDFVRIRSSFVMNEADILDLDQLRLPAASSPPGFGKSIDEDWENFANLDAVLEVPEPNWSLHPHSLEQVPTVETTLSEATVRLDNVEQVEGLFNQLELIEQRMDIFEPEPPAPIIEPPPYDPGLPYLPDYESLMRLENAKSGQKLPDYTEVMEQRSKKSNYVNSIEDLYADLDVNEVEINGSPVNQSNEIHNFEALCQEMAVVVPSERQAPQPAPRSNKSARSLNVRGSTSPLACYQPEELPSSSSSDTDGEEGARSAPVPAKRDPKALKVRFDVDNLQYYQSAEVVTSGEESQEDEPLHQPTPMQRSIIFEPSNTGLPILFGSQVSQEDSDDDDGFGRAISQHRSMTATLRTNAIRNHTDA